MTTTCNITSSTCPFHPLDGVGYGLLFLLGFFVNAAALRAFIAQRSSWTDTHIYILNLVLADTTLIVFLPFRVFDAFSCLSVTDLCTFLINIHYINMYASILTSMAISTHRYVAVRFPLQARSWRWKKWAAVVVCLTIWVTVVVICVLYRDENNPEKLWSCYERCRDKRLKWEFMVLLVVLGFLTPLLIVLFCSSQIIYILFKNCTKSEEIKLTINIITANMIVFIVCYTPIHISFVVSYNSEPPLNWSLRNTTIPEHSFLIFSEWMASTNCCFDSVSYYFLLKRFYTRATNEISN